MKKNFEFLFSVVTINFNNSKGLERTIKSVISQTERESIQYIVVDGDSTDNSQSIINKYRKHIDKIVIEKDKGVYDAMNKGLMLSSSKWTIFMNSGDIFSDKDIISQMMIKSEKHPHCIAIYGNTLLSDSQLWETKPVDELWKGMICSHQSIAIDTLHLKAIKFDLNFEIAADYKTILSAYMTGLPFIKIGNKPISQIEPVGISSEFRKRTLERWLINKQLTKSGKSREKINRFYSHLLHSRESTQSSSSNLQQNPSKNYIEENIIFLVSMPRSGSTLLQRIIETSQYIESTSEPWVALPILSLYDQEMVESVYDQEVLNSAREALTKELKAIKEMYENAEKSYLESIYSEILTIIEAPYYLDKTPRYSLIIDKLYQRFPNSKYIILHRNPLCVVNSYCSTWAKGNLKWVANNKAFMNDFKHGFINLIEFSLGHKSSRNVLEINYDALVNDPGAAKTLINNFLGVSIQIENFNQKNMVKRELGDPKTINNTSKILKNNTDPLDTAKSFVEKDWYRTIIKQIPKKVFNYHKVDANLFLNKLSTSLNAKESEHQITTTKSYQFGVSVIITCYNNSKTIINAVSSALNQTRPPEEIVIIDDFSTDDSVVKIKRYLDEKKLSAHILIIENTENKGVSTSRDIAIRNSHYKFFTTLDGDDTMSPVKLKSELQAIIDNDAQVAFSDIKMLTADGSKLLNTRFYHKKNQYELLTALATRSHPVPRDMMIDKDLYISVGGFLKGFNLFEDWMLKQKLTTADGSTGWVHSGVVGTNYDRTNPGLSNKTNIQLLFAQLKVLAINSDMLCGLKINWEAVFIQLLRLDSNYSLIEFRQVVENLHNDAEFSRFVDLVMRQMHYSLSKLPANHHSDGKIINALNLLWSGSK